MLFINVVLLGTAALAAAANPFKRADGFPIETIPASCDSYCQVYKKVFNTCPGNPSDALCTGVCNGTTLTELQVCINCTLIDGPPNGMTQFNIDVLNAAQQQLAQSCIDEAFPATFTGKYPAPSTVPYPSGVDKATHILNGTVAPSPTPTKTANSSTSAAASATNGTVNTPPTSTGKLDGGASTLSVSGLLALTAAGVALVL